jgi:hypothetical protein
MTSSPQHCRRGGGSRERRDRRARLHRRRLRRAFPPSRLRHARSPSPRLMAASRSRRSGRLAPATLAAVHHPYTLCV